MQVLGALVDALHHNTTLPVRRSIFGALNRLTHIVFVLTFCSHATQLPEVEAMRLANNIPMPAPPPPQQQ